MAKKKKKRSNLKKILAAGAALAGLGAMMRNRGDRGLTPVRYIGQNMDTGLLPTGDARVAENIANFDRGMDRMGAFNEFGQAGVATMKKGGRVGYGKGGKVLKGCGKVMAGRNKKTKYI